MEKETTEYLQRILEYQRAEEWSLDQLAVIREILLLRGEDSPEVKQPFPEQVHTVSPGDSLRLIALKYYGRAGAGNWRFIFDANRDEIGENPYLLRPGSRLLIPALGSEPRPSQDSAQSIMIPVLASEPPPSQDSTQSNPLQNLGCLAMVVLPITMAAFNAWRHFRIFGSWDLFPYPDEANLFYQAGLIALAACLALNFSLNRILHPDTVLGGFVSQTPAITNVASITVIVGSQMIVWASMQWVFAHMLPEVRYRPFHLQELILPAIVVLLIVGFSIVIGIGSLQRQAQRHL
jgi:hypothetical protein